MKDTPLKNGIEKSHTNKRMKGKCSEEFVQKIKQSPKREREKEKESKNENITPTTNCTLKKIESKMTDDDQTTQRKCQRMKICDNIKSGTRTKTEHTTERQWMEREMEQTDIRKDKVCTKSIISVFSN